MELTTRLTNEEQALLTDLETTIKANIKGFIKVGLALKEIKENELFRESYKSFEDYCKHVWGMCKTYAYDQIKAPNVVHSLSQSFRNCGNSEKPVELLLPQNEAQTRPLIKLPTAQQIKAWQEIIEQSAKDDVPITAKLVKKVAGRYIEKNKQQKEDELKDAATSAGNEPEEKVVETPEYFSTAYNQFVEVIESIRKNNFKDMKRKVLLEWIEQLKDYAESNA